VLHVLRLRQSSSGTIIDDTSSQITETALALSEACIQCARRSYRLLSEAWINGSFPTFDYTYTQYLFSSSTILAVSSLFQSLESQSDGDDFETAAAILKQLYHNGNLPAKEFCSHVEAIKGLLAEAHSQGSLAKQNGSTGVASIIPLGVANSFSEARSLNDGPPVASKPTLPEPSLQDLLSAPDLDLGFLESSIIDESFQAFVWPEDCGTWSND
jgi:proline utilization trans-activator